MRVAIQGCCHGELHQVFQRVAELHAENPIDLLLILGDFQSIRDEKDFQSISIPPKYQKYGDFRDYYHDDELKPSVLTLFIGGNHESMRHLMLLPHGGYAARDIYYLGYSNVIWYRGLRIGSLSGIWKKWDFHKDRPSWETLESGQWSSKVRELYHVRSSDTKPLFMLNGPLDIMMSHDWPNEVVYHGNTQDLLKWKPFFKKDIQTHQLGNPISWKLLTHLKPKWWFSAHLHVKYKAIVKHNKRKKKNQDEVDLDLSSEDERDDLETVFLALDKCLPRMQWLEIIDIEPDTTHPSFKNKDTLYWDPEFISNLQTVADQNSIPKVKDAIDWDQYQIPQYVPGIQRQETEQTSNYNHKFFSNIYNA